MIALSPRPFCPCDGHQTGLLYLPARWRESGNSRSTWGSSSSCTTSASEAKRCCLRSLSSWSRKTLESNKSVLVRVWRESGSTSLERPYDQMSLQPQDGPYHADHDDGSDWAPNKGHFR